MSTEARARERRLRSKRTRRALEAEVRQFVAEALAFRRRPVPAFDTFPTAASIR